MLYVKIIDDKGKEIELDTITATGLTMLLQDCDNLKEKLAEQLFEKEKNEN